MGSFASPELDNIVDYVEVFDRDIEDHKRQVYNLFHFGRIGKDSISEFYLILELFYRYLDVQNIEYCSDVGGIELFFELWII